MQKRNIYSKISLLLTAALLLNLLFGISVSAQDMEAQQTWSLETGYVQNRIPGIIAAADGSILVYWEARTSTASDTEPTDIQVWRSTDNGNSFTKVWTLGNQATARYTNPVMVVDQEGTVHLLYASSVGNDGVYHVTSKDHGLSWSTPVNIIDAFEKEAIGWSMVNLGPGHGICLQNGEHAGRLVFSVWCYTGAYDVYTLYSDDNGVTWEFGDCAEGNFDETAIAELSDGSVMLNSRQYSVPYDTTNSEYEGMSRPTASDEAYRYIIVSDTGVGNWSDTRMDTALQNPSVQGSMFSAMVDGRHVLLYAGCDSQTARENLSVRISYDDGKSWSEPIVVASNAAYSDIAVVNGSVYVIYETHPTLRLTSFSLSDFKAPSTVSWVGKGTESEPYLLERMADLKALCNSTSDYANTCFKLCFDPDFSTVVGWQGIGNQAPFAGSFDGNGHTVINDLNDSLFAEITNEQNVTNLNYETDIFSEKNYGQIGIAEDFRIRFVTELNCAPELLSEAGFEVTVVYQGKRAEVTLRSSYVYQTLKGKSETYSPKTGLYFLACGIKEIPTDDIVSFTFRPFAVVGNETFYGNESSFNAFNGDLFTGLVSKAGDCIYVSWDTLLGE